MNFQELEKSEIEVVQGKVDLDSKTLQEIVDGIVNPYFAELDKYIDFIRDLLTDTQNPPSAYELDDFCLNLSMQLYYAGAMQERIGIKDDISRAVYKEMYNAQRQNQIKGTVADKDSIAELNSQAEYLTNICYHKAYITAKAKVSAAQELLSSIKKVISRRQAEMELTRIGGRV